MFLVNGLGDPRPGRGQITVSITVGITVSTQRCPLSTVPDDRVMG
jgi:hypothetical protein